MCQIYSLFHESCPTEVQKDFVTVPISIMGGGSFLLLYGSLQCFIAIARESMNTNIQDFSFRRTETRGTLIKQ